MNASMPHDTYLDHVFSKTEQQWEHRYGYLKDKVPKPCEGNTMYYSLEWNNQYYEAVVDENPEKPSVKWLQQNLRSVASLVDSTIVSTTSLFADSVSTR